MEIQDFLKYRFNNFKIVGSDAIVVCPFHDDHYPGHLYVNLDSGIWHCFHASCEKKGNFNSLLKQLGDTRYIGKVSIKDIRFINLPIKYRESIEELDESVLSAFSNKISVDMLENGFLPDILKIKQIGFDEIAYRVTFPIRNIKGELVGVCGRAVFEDQFPRYKFYSSEFKSVYPRYSFNKENHLYNADLVKKYLNNRPEDLILVEGFKACLWLLQNGFNNVVALMGASITDPQLKLLSHLSSEFTLFMDNDIGGRKRLEYLTEKLLSIGKARIIVGYRRQPDQYSKEELTKLYKEKISLATYITIKDTIKPLIKGE